MIEWLVSEGVVKDHVLLFMELLMRQCQESNVNCHEMYEEDSLSCVKKTNVYYRLVSLQQIVSLLK
jgi:hypothetical protein